MNPESRQYACVQAFVNAFDSQDWIKAKTCLSPRFEAVWPQTRERFSRDGFIAMNAAYPGRWHLRLQRYEETPQGAVSVIHVTHEDEKIGHCATTFYRFDGDLIASIEEYWATEEPAPEWRRQYHSHEGKANEQGESDESTSNWF